MQEKIARRAYELYELGNYQDGYALTHWLQAEREIVSESRAMSSSKQKS
jgi:outer membrane protein TolC